MFKYLLIGLLCLNAFALPEAELPLIWEDVAYRYYTSTPLESFKNQQGMTLQFRSFTHPGNQKVMVIIPGRSEPAVKYAELIYDLRLKDFDIHILDLQGQGESDRLLKDSHKGFVRNFGDYVRDFSLWMDSQVLLQTKGKSVYLLAHSMGGAIGAYYLAAKPTVFKKAVLVSPMMELNTKPYSETVASLYAVVLVKIGLGKNYAPGHGPYKPENDLFEKNTVTTSEARFKISKTIFTEWPELIVGGPTARWVNESLKSTKKIDELAAKIQTPLLILQAGADQIVKLGRQNTFCSKSASCKLVHYKDAGHEILMEKDGIRDLALKEILKFF